MPVYAYSESRTVSELSRMVATKIPEHTRFSATDINLTPNLKSGPVFGGQVRLMGKLKSKVRKTLDTTYHYSERELNTKSNAFIIQ